MVSMVETFGGRRTHQISLKYIVNADSIPLRGQNPKHEIPKDPNEQNSKHHSVTMPHSFCFLSSELRAGFGFRDSDFGFAASPRYESLLATASIRATVDRHPPIGVQSRCMDRRL
jgi:hypothetical protein